MTGDLFYLKGPHKVRLGFILLKIPKQGMTEHLFY